MPTVQEHFDTEAQRYDSWKQRNDYYYATVKRIYLERIPPGASVLEVGCGTGDILSELPAGRAVGIDISAAMIAIAAAKHPGIRWYAATTSELHRHIHEAFDIIYLSDVIEHLDDVTATFRDLRRFTHPGTRLIVNMANPLWAPILYILEKLHMKMPEGPHHWTSAKRLTAILRECGFARKSLQRQLMFPTRLPVLSALCARLERLPLLNRLCLIQILEFTPAGA
jgi:ubiquinone/menaquinone biosynthesis C-methylase UbiE